MNRRGFIKRSAAAAATLLSPEIGSLLASPRMEAAETPLNILFILVDQLRDPQWFPDQPSLDQALPAMARMRSGAVSFGQHYVAATACTPSRSNLLTGLYSHQTGCLVTSPVVGQPDLRPGFPTWGTLLRSAGYETFWWGKWHLSESCDMEQYGFSGGSCSSPNGLPGEGLTKDPLIVDQFLAWLQKQGTSGPWATTVSLVNPHDVGWYPQGTEHQGYAGIPAIFNALPPNFEASSDLLAHNKPRLQIAVQETLGQLLGALPDSGSGFETGWLRLMDLYLHIQRQLDTQIGRVLDALAASPFASNTIIVFTSDHGEYAGSHGLRGKAFANYDEALRVPLYVKDPTGRFTTRPDITRTQLTSHVDIVPLLLTLATGSNDWRSLPEAAHLARRLDIAAILADPVAPGRPYVLHTSDEELWESLTIPLGFEDMPFHVIGYRTATAKLGLYSSWLTGTIDLETSGQELECYDYSTPEGRLELDNVAGTNLALTEQLRSRLVDDALPRELREPLPNYLRAAQQEGFTNYLTWRERVRSVLSPSSVVIILSYCPRETGSVAESIVLTNESDAPITIQSISFVGDHPTDFTQTNDAGASILPGARCSVSVTFLPTELGVRNGIMVIRHTGTGNTLYITLVGVGTQNLLRNPGFELDSDQNWVPDGWNENSRVTRSQTLVRSGRYAMKHTASDNATYAISQEIAKLQAGVTYKVAGWVNIPSVNPGFALTLAVQWYTTDNLVLATHIVRNFTAATTDWEQAAVSLVAPAQTAYARLIMSVTNLKTTFYVDDCSFETQNMVLNAGFELDSDQNGTTNDWSVNSLVTQSQTLVRSGRYAMKATAPVAANYLITQKVSRIEPETAYDVSAWVNIPIATGDFGFQLAITWHAADNTKLATSVIKRYTSATFNWDLAYALCTSPADTSYALIGMSTNGVNPAIYIDDVAMRMGVSVSGFMLNTLYLPVVQS